MTTNETPVREKIRPIKSVCVQRRWLGKKRNCFTASLPGLEWEATSETKQGAIDALATKLKLQAQFSHCRHYARKGCCTFILSYRDGWTYDIMRDSDMEKPDGSHAHGSCSFGANSFREAVAMMMNHVHSHDGL